MEYELWNTTYLGVTRNSTQVDANQICQHIPIPTYTNIAIAAIFAFPLAYSSSSYSTETPLDRVILIQPGSLAKAPYSWRVQSVNWQSYLSWRLHSLPSTTDLPTFTTTHVNLHTTREHNHEFTHPLNENCLPPHLQLLFSKAKPWRGGLDILHSWPQESRRMRINIHSVTTWFRMTRLSTSCQVGRDTMTWYLAILQSCPHTATIIHCSYPPDHTPSEHVRTSFFLLPVNSSNLKHLWRLSHQAVKQAVSK